MERGLALLERLGVLERLGPWLERLGVSGLLLRFGLQIGAGILVGGIIALLLFLALTKLASGLRSEFVKHDRFPAIMCAVMLVVPTAVAFLGQGIVAGIGALCVASFTAMGLHPRLVQIQQGERKKDPSAKSAPESPTA